MAAAAPEHFGNTSIIRTLAQDTLPMLHYLMIYSYQMSSSGEISGEIQQNSVAALSFPSSSPHDRTPSSPEQDTMTQRQYRTSRSAPAYAVIDVWRQAIKRTLSEKGRPDCDASVGRIARHEKSAVA